MTSPARTLRSALRTRRALVLENLALKQQLSVRYLTYRSRTHLALAPDTPEPRPVGPPTMGEIVELPEVGGLHHRYERRAA